MLRLKSLLVAGAIALPLQYPGDWQLLEYRDLPANAVEFGAAGMAVRVDASASPIVYPLPEPVRIERIEVSGHLDGLLALEPGIQGSRDGDDFALKLGLVVAGGKTLNPVQRLFTAGWIERLYALAPEGAGIDRIEFFNAVQEPALLGARRRHPLSDLIYENNVWLIDVPGKFDLSHRLDEPLEVIAIWLSIDGDDSQSRYTTLIRDLRLHAPG